MSNTTEVKQETPAPAKKTKPKRTPEEKAARKQKKEQAAATAAKKSEVRYSVNQINGSPLHLCGDGEWRTDDDLVKLGEEASK